MSQLSSTAVDRYNDNADTEEVRDSIDQVDDNDNYRPQGIIVTTVDDDINYANYLMNKEWLEKKKRLEEGRDFAKIQFKRIRQKAVEDKRQLDLEVRKRKENLDLLRVTTRKVARIPIADALKRKALDSHIQSKMFVVDDILGVHSSDDDIDDSNSTPVPSGDLKKTLVNIATGGVKAQLTWRPSAVKSSSGEDDTQQPAARARPKPFVDTLTKTRALTSQSPARGRATTPVTKPANPKQQPYAPALRTRPAMATKALKPKAALSAKTKTTKKTQVPVASSAKKAAAAASTRRAVGTARRNAGVPTRATDDSLLGLLETQSAVFGRASEEGAKVRGGTRELHSRVEDDGMVLQEVSDEDDEEEDEEDDDEEEEDDEEDEEEFAQIEENLASCTTVIDEVGRMSELLREISENLEDTIFRRALVGDSPAASALDSQQLKNDLAPFIAQKVDDSTKVIVSSLMTSWGDRISKLEERAVQSHAAATAFSSSAAKPSRSAAAQTVAERPEKVVEREVERRRSASKYEYSYDNDVFSTGRGVPTIDIPAARSVSLPAPLAPRQPTVASGIKLADELLRGSMGILNDRDDVITAFNATVSGTLRKVSEIDYGRRSYFKVDVDGDDDAMMDGSLHRAGTGPIAIAPSVQWSNLHGLVPSLRNVGELASVLDANLIGAREESERGKDIDWTDDESESGEDDNRIISLYAVELLRQKEADARLEEEALLAQAKEGFRQYMAALEDPEPVTDVSGADSPMKAHIAVEEQQPHRPEPVSAPSDSQEVSIDSFTYIAPTRSSRSGQAVAQPQSEEEAPRYTPAELRQFMLDELKRQDDILKYELELSELEQMRSIQSANEMVQQILMKSQIDAIEYRKEQEISLQQQAYEVSLTTAIANAQVAMKEKMMSHEKTVSELKEQLQQQALQNDYAVLIAHAEQLQQASEQLEIDRWGGGVRKASSEPMQQMPFDDDIDAAEISYAASIEQSRISMSSTIPEEIDDFSGRRRGRRRALSDEGEYSFEFEEPSEVEEDDGLRAVSDSLPSRPRASAASPARQAQRPLRGPFAASASSALTLLSRRSDLTSGSLKGSSVDSGKMALSSGAVSEYKEEMDYRLRTQEKAIKLRLHLLKSKRNQQLEYLHQQKVLLQAKSSPKERSELMTMPQILGEEKIVNDVYAEERALLEKERWSLNAKMYREMRKYQQLKRDVEGFASGSFTTKMISSPSDSSSPDSAVPLYKTRDADSVTADSIAPLKRPTPKGKRVVEAAARSSAEPAESTEEPVERGRAKAAASDKRSSGSKKKRSASPKTPHYALPLERSRSNTPERISRSPSKPSSPKERDRPTRLKASLQGGQKVEPRQPRALPDYLKSVDDIYVESDEDHASEEAILQLEKSIVERQQRITDMKRNITTMNTEYNRSEIIRLREIERDRLIAEEAVLKVSLSEDIQRVSKEFKDMKQAAMSKSSVYQEVVTKWVDIIEKPFEEEVGVMKEEDELDGDSWVSESEDVDGDHDIISQAHEGQLVKRAREHAAAVTIQNTMRHLSVRRAYSSRRNESELARAALKEGKIVGDVVQEHYQTVLTEDVNLEDSFASGDASSEDDDALIRNSKAIEEAIDNFADVKHQREDIEKERLAILQKERERLEEQERAKASRQEALDAAKAAAAVDVASSPLPAAKPSRELLNDSLEYDAENEISRSQFDIEESFTKNKAAEDAVKSGDKEELMTSQQFEDSGSHTVAWTEPESDIKKTVSDSSLNKVNDEDTVATDNTIGTYETLESLMSNDTPDIIPFIVVSSTKRDAESSSVPIDEEPSSSVDEDLDEISDENETRDDKYGDDSDDDDVDQSQLDVSVARSEKLDVSVALSERSGASAASVAKSERSLGRSDRLDLSVAMSEKSGVSVVKSDVSTATAEFSVVDSPGKIKVSSVDAVFENRLASPKESQEPIRSAESPHIKEEDFVNRSTISMGTIKSFDEPVDVEAPDSVYKAIAEHSFLTVSSSQVSLNTEGNDFPEVSIIDQYGEESIGESIASADEEEDEDDEEDDKESDASPSPPKQTPMTSLANIPKLALNVGASKDAAGSGALDELYDFDSKAPSADTPRIPESTAAPATTAAKGPEEEKTETANPYHDWSPQVVEAASAIMSVEHFDSLARKIDDPSFSGEFVSAAGYREIKETLQVDGQHSLAVFQKVNAVLSELHALRHEVRHSSRLSRKHLIAKSMPLRSDVLLEHVLSAIKRDQAEVAAVVSNRKDLFALIKVDAVEELEDKYEEELARVGNEVADSILARLLVETTESLLKKF